MSIFTKKTMLMTGVNIFIEEEQYHKLLDVQLERRKANHKNRTIANICSEILNTVLKDDELLKKVLDHKNKFSSTNH